MGDTKSEPTSDLTEKIIAIIKAEVEEGNALAGFADKERQLEELIESMTPVEVLALKQRLRNQRADDPLIVAFMRFTRDRRDRIMSFLDSPALRQRGRTNGGLVLRTRKL